jgi:acyl phosphate:glycerol-3-phosphate acyltransferase
MINIVYPMVIAYLLGAIPFSYILGRTVKGVDIRQTGSHNIGATNLMRCAGKALGITALILDISKGILAVSVIAVRFYNPSMMINPHLFRVILGLTSVAGHIWTVFLRFKGGKGVATTIGVLLGLSPLVAILSLAVWSIFTLIYRYVSLSSLAMAVSLPVFMYCLNQPAEYTVLAIILCIVIIVRHRLNIRGLINGTEYKINQKIK